MRGREKRKEKSVTFNPKGLVSCSRKIIKPSAYSLSPAEGFDYFHDNLVQFEKHLKKNRVICKNGMRVKHKSKYQYYYDSVDGLYGVKKIELEDRGNT